MKTARVKWSKKHNIVQKSKMQYEEILKEFWRKVEQRDRVISLGYKLKLLIKMSDIVIKKVENLNKARRDFNINKPRGYFKKNCFVCSRQGDIRHHIIQLQNGGDSNELNIVELCCICHEIIHPWLRPENIARKRVKELVLYRDNGRGGYDPVIR